MVRDVLALALVAATASAAEPPCLVSVSVEPERSFVGQQVLYRLQILRRADVSSVAWVEPLSFPSLRAEWLPGSSPDPAIQNVGPHRLVFEERRALFPARAGDLAIPPARLACRLDEGAGGESAEVEVPGARLHVEPLPSRGRPADFSGVVGPIEVASSVSAERVALGGSLSLTVTVSGAVNAWAAAPHLAELAGVDVYRRPPSVALDPGRVLVARRSFGYELVPRRSGSLVVPAVRVPWFDPARGEYRIAESPALEVAVAEAAAPPERAPAPRPAARAESGNAHSDAGWRWALGGALSLAAAAIVLLAARIALWRLAPQRAARPLLASATRAIERGDAAEASTALAGALRAALEARLPGTRALSVEEIRARGGVDASFREVADALAQLDRDRFARRAAPAAPDVGRVRALVRRL